MTTFTRPIAALLLLLISSFLMAPTEAQQKRQTPAKPQPRVAPAPAPTFDTLIPSDKYNVYVEVRGVGQLIKSNSVSELLDPVLKLGGPPKEFRTLVAWLNTHADQVMAARLLVATWPSAKDVPEAVVAIEFASAEEASKFATPLREFLPKVLPPKPAETPESQTEKPEAGQTVKPIAQASTPGPLTPSYYLQQSGSLILLSPTPLNLKKFKPAGSKLLSDDINFRTARNRFSSEPVFVFVDMKAMERQDEEQKKKYEEMRVEAEKQQKAMEEQQKEAAEEITEAEIAEQERLIAEAEARTQILGTPSAPVVVAEPSPPDPVSAALNMIAPSFFGGNGKWPEAVALALSLENDSYDVRALFINQPGEKSDAVPFLPALIPGQPIVPESPNILPADSEMVVMMSLDLPQIYLAMSRPRPNSTSTYDSKGNFTSVTETVHPSPFAEIEKRLQLSLKDDVLPLLGSEIAIRLPVKDFGIFGLNRTSAPNTQDKTSANQGPLLVISLKDKEAVRTLMPKIVDGLAVKGASAIAQTERREDTEIVSYAGLFSYAFVGNFLLLSADPATTRYVVDSYLKHETLATDPQFRTFTRWQPKPAHGQIYVSPALMESYKSWVQQPSSRFSDQTRATLTRLTEVAQPITYSLSNEGLGPLHELHLPKNLVLMAVAGLSGESNPPPSLVNERRAMGMLHSIASAQHRFKDEKGNGSFGTLEQLVAAELIPEEMLKLSGYKVELTVTGDNFEVTAVPLEYGKSGTMSYFIDQTFTLRGGDKNGASATSSDPPVSPW